MLSGAWLSGVKTVNRFGAGSGGYHASLSFTLSYVHVHADRAIFERARVVPALADRLLRWLEGVMMRREARTRVSERASA